jgi:hypothetical protein
MLLDPGRLNILRQDREELCAIWNSTRTIPVSTAATMPNTTHVTPYSRVMCLFDPKNPPFEPQLSTYKTIEPSACADGIL